MGIFDRLFNRDDREVTSRDLKIALKGVERERRKKQMEIRRLVQKRNETLARLIEMTYFGGMTAEETAQALGMSVHVVRHDLRFAQAWLRRKLAQ